MNWITISDLAQLDLISQNSFQKSILIFKHSTRCSVSSMILHRLERETTPENIEFYFLDLLRHRNISNSIAEKFSVHHESPQVLLIKNGECIYEESHNGITMSEIVSFN